MYLPKQSQRELDTPFLQHLDSLAHQCRIHANQPDGERIAQKLLLNHDSFPHDRLYSLHWRPTFEMGEEKASKVGVKSLVAGDELVGEAKARHESSLF